MYASIDPERGGMEDILRSLGTVLDTQMARAVEIRQRGDSLVVRALAVAGIAQRLDGAWTQLEQVITHVDVTQAQIASAARDRAGHVTGPHERSLRVLGRVIDRRGLREVTLIQHPSDTAWLLWHRASGDADVTLMTLTQDELVAADAAAALVREQLATGAPESSQVRLRAQWARRSDGRAPRSRPMCGPREALRVGPGRAVLARAGAGGD